MLCSIGKGLGFLKVFTSYNRDDGLHLLNLNIQIIISGLEECHSGISFAVNAGSFQDNGSMLAYEVLVGGVAAVLALNDTNSGNLVGFFSGQTTVAVGFESIHQLIEYSVNAEDFLLSDAKQVVIKCSGSNKALSTFLDISGLIDYGRRVAGAGSYNLLAC